jgi:hypothetical protein
MKALTSAAGLALMLAAGSSTADDVYKSGTPVGKETAPVTVTGCLLAGTRPDTFVLKNVTDSAGRSPDVIYWLSTTRGLKDHVGQTIEVTGPVVAISEGELEVKTNPAKSPDTTIQVKARGKEAKAKTTDDTIGEGRTKEERTMPVHRIKVRSLRMVAPTCR